MTRELKRARPHDRGADPHPSGKPDQHVHRPVRRRVPLLYQSGDGSPSRTARWVRNPWTSRNAGPRPDARLPVRIPRSFEPSGSAPRRFQTPQFESESRLRADPVGRGGPLPPGSADRSSNLPQSGAQIPRRGRDGGAPKLGVRLGEHLDGSLEPSASQRRDPEHDGPASPPVERDVSDPVTEHAA
jgi:hypothetical protein